MSWLFSTFHWFTSSLVHHIYNIIYNSISTYYFTSVCIDIITVYIYIYIYIKYHIYIYTIPIGPIVRLALVIFTACKNSNHDGSIMSNHVKRPIFWFKRWLRHTVDGCEILHHQTDCWNMLKPFETLVVFFITSLNQVDAEFRNHSLCQVIWLVVYLPLCKIWVRQLWWWHSQYTESHKIHVPNHQPN